MRIEPDQLTAQRSAGKPFHFCLSPRSSERHRGRGTDDFGIITIRHDHAAGMGQEILGLQHGAVEMRREAPVEAVAMIQVIGPLAVAEKIGAAHLDLDDHDLPLGIDAHEVGAPARTQRH